jgi:hypothetical protein
MSLGGGGSTDALTGLNRQAVNDEVARYYHTDPQARAHGPLGPRLRLRGVGWQFVPKTPTWTHTCKSNSGSTRAIGTR